MGVAVGSGVGVGGTLTVTLDRRRRHESCLSKSLNVPEKVYVSSVVDAVTVYVKEASPCRVNLTRLSPSSATWASSRLLDS